MSQAEVEDIYVLPDYVSWIKAYVDSSLAHLHKEDYTKLQWIFEYTKPDRYFPFGVKTLYRDYSSDRICIIREVPKGSASTIIGQNTGLEAHAVPVKNHPTSDAFPERPVEGFYLLDCKKLPCTGRDRWNAEAFAEGTKEEFETIRANVYSFYPIDNPKRSDWTKWFNSLCPMTDSVDEYIKTHSFPRPLESIFNSSTVLTPEWLVHGVSTQYTVTEELTEADWSAMAVAETQDSVVCRFNTHPPPPLLFFSNGGDHVTTFLENAKCFYSIQLPKYTNELLKFYLR